MRLSLLLVHYRTPGLLRRAVESARADLAAAGLAGEVIVVDNGSGPGDHEALTAGVDRLLEPGENLGFARGMNLAADAADGDLLVLLNPDAELLPGCLAALAAAVAAGAAAAGPRLYWDSGRRLLLPPAERRDRASDLAARLAASGGAWAAWGRRRWRRHARRHWRAEKAVPSLHLSGSVLAVSRAAWQRVGPLDPGYFLYFEETDWLLRLRRAGLPAVYEPRAEARHRYAGSAALEPRAAQWFAASEERFVRRWYGDAWWRLAGRLGARAARRTPDWPPPLPGHGPGSGGPAPKRPALDLSRWSGAPLWIEVSPLARGFPAAAERLPAGTAGWELPSEIWEGLAPGPLRLAVVDERGRELAAWRAERVES